MDATVPANGSAPRPTHRRLRATRVAAMLVALGVGGWLIAVRPPAPPKPTPVAAPQPPALPALGQTWPKARVSTVAGKLADGTAYTAWLFLDATVSVGTAPTPDNSFQRLLVRAADGSTRELRRVPSSRFPQFLGFTAVADTLYWVESTATVSGPSETRIWRAALVGGRPPVSLTTNTGAAVFFNSQYDLVVVDGRVHWIAAAPTDTLTTEVRSVPIGGGQVNIRTVPGAFGLSAWPWLIGAGGPDTPLDLVNLSTGQRVRVPRAAAELVGCSPVWCRAVIVGQSGGAARFDLMKPDGSGRRRVAGGTVSAAISDVALLDRFEVFTEATATALRLLLFDIDTGKSTVVADDVGMVLAHGGLVWWSIGADADAAGDWHALDLRTL